VPRSVFAACFSLPSSIFLAQLVRHLRCVVFGLRSLALGHRMVQAKDPRPKTQDRFSACVAEQLKPLTVNQASLKRLRRCESYRMHQTANFELRSLYFVRRLIHFLETRSKAPSTKHKALQNSVICPPVCQKSTRSVFLNTPRRQ
jgi:hypothetical protein